MDYPKAFLDAVCIGRAFYLKFLSINTNLIKNNRPIPFANPNPERGWGASSAPLQEGELVPTLGLLDVCTKLIVKKEIEVVEFEDQDAPNGVIQSMLWCQPDTNEVIIFVRKSISFCAKRFCVAKELIHLVQGAVDPTTRFADGAQIAELLRCLVSDIRVPDQPDYVVLEDAAEPGAIELLFPQERYVEALDSINSGAMTHMDIAVLNRIPLKVVEFRFNNVAAFFYDTCYQNWNYTNAEFKDVRGY